MHRCGTCTASVGESQVRVRGTAQSWGKETDNKLSRRNIVTQFLQLTCSSHHQFGEITVIFIPILHRRNERIREVM